MKTIILSLILGVSTVLSMSEACTHQRGHGCPAKHHKHLGKHHHGKHHHQAKTGVKREHKH